MPKKEAGGGKAAESAAAPHRVRLPGFITGDEIGLGEVIKRVTATVGIKPCGGCRRRAAALDRWVVFTGSRKGSDRNSL